MDRREFNRLMGLLAVSPVLKPAEVLDLEGAGAPTRPGRSWSLTADVAECCSCAIPCPCNFGKPVETCFGNRLIEIREGQLEGDDLAGLRFLVTFQMGRWTRIYVDDALSEEQSATLDRLLPVAFAGFDRLARSKESVPLRVERGDDTFRFSVPDSTVEMKLLPGLGGEPIRVDGLPSNAFHRYVQYESVVHEHSRADAEWSYSGTNGFRSEMRASG